MAPYDSDSSAGEEEDYAETNVLLGYASKDPGDDSTSRLGGQPEWLAEDTPPSAGLARCKICKDIMVMLLQLNGELPDRFPGHERRLYVFACRKKSCRRRDGSIRTLRSIRVAPGSKAVALKGDKREEKAKSKSENDTPKPPANLGETLFGATTMGSGGNANPFSSSSNSSAPSNPFSSTGAAASNPFASTAPTQKSDPKPEPVPTPSASEDLTSLPKTFAETLSLNTTPTPVSPPEPWPPSAEQPKPYPISYLSEAEYETLDPTPTPAHDPSKMQIDTGDEKDSKSGGKNGGKEDKEVFESSMDAAFQKFADRLAQNPEQSIRYEFSGAPLLYSRTDAVGQVFLGSAGVAAALGSAGPSTIAGGGKGMPRCANCGAGRTFEVQLCPHAITELEAGELSLEGMDWGTVIVGVCERDCQARGVDEGQVGYLEEWVGVQWEEMAAAEGKR
ncbi:hypothetical protein F5Y15DRAFT_382027 [Xylariaceae sp. FL0016]|nr:hypothetical protein F5Y15DRAFT_382027 [Xylariaceae sp. FL0016]